MRFLGLLSPLNACHKPREELRCQAWLYLAVGQHVHQGLRGQVANSDVLRFATFLMCSFSSSLV